MKVFTLRPNLWGLLAEFADNHERPPFSIKDIVQLFHRYLGNKAYQEGDIYIFKEDPLAEVLNIPGLHSLQIIGLIQKELRPANLPVSE